MPLTPAQRSARSTGATSTKACSDASRGVSTAALGAQARANLSALRRQAPPDVRVIFQQIDEAAASMPRGTETRAVDTAWIKGGWMALRQPQLGLVCGYIAWTYCSLGARSPELASHFITRAFAFHTHCANPAPPPPSVDDVLAS